MSGTSESSSDRPLPPAASDPPPVDSEEQLAQIMSDLADRSAKGEQLELEQVLEEHPEFADEIRDLWSAVVMANVVGSDVRDASRTAANADITAAIQLPCRLGDYELLEELGRGGMGVVYKARHLTLNRIVALKMLLRGRFASNEDQARFRAEAEAIAQLDHPNIVPVYEVGQLEGHVYFSMKYVQGCTLQQRLAEAGPLEAREAARIMSAVSSAVDFAHRRGVLHRDLKPSNIMMDDEGQPHVNDFGLAKQLSEGESITRTGAVIGTPAYMSPEQAAGNRGQVGPASDVYGLGSILYHMIAGQPPFTGGSAVDIVLRVLEEDAPPARTVNAAADRDLEMIITRCMQKPIDLRYDSAASLTGDLNAWLADEPVAARTGRLSQVVALMFRETHHAAILENWGLLWMWHGLVLFVVCALTQVLQWRGVDNRLTYFLLWTAGLGTWALVFWMLRQRMGPVTFVERQIAHVWAGSMISIGFLFPLEALLELPVLTLSPLLGLSSGVVFLVKASMLSGSFYFPALALFATTFAMAQWPDYGHLIFGLVSALCFFLPGWKYYRRKQLAS